ncbi:ABC transporter ATP-binding protein [Pseudoxanthobacter sp. M-2]|uniref:ABC transporter ATP-binding protein n=1 Tax=Pseudoxanthobacter sp. M-2 TaxID=3078754 RepID=UPI0038FCC6BF
MVDATSLTTAEPVLEIDDLHVSFATPQGDVQAVHGLSMTIGAGETVGVVGESGSGKSQAMMAAMGLLARNGRATGAVRYRGRDILGLPARALNDIRGARIGMIFQEPMTSLDPLYRVGSQIAEPLVRHRKISWSEAKAQSVELLHLVGIPEPERRVAAYPHELSGGQRQRVMIAMAIANEPDVLIADEPTTALDVTVQAQIIDLLQDLQARFGMAIVFISHDLGLVRRIAGRVVVMRHGEVVETGPTADVFERPQHPYTRMLVDAQPRGRKTPPPPGAPEVLRARDVAVEFKLGGGLLRGAPLVIRAVEGVNLSLARGETIGIVGESGSGKSTLGRALLRLVPCAGDVTILGQRLAALDPAALRALRRRVQLVFQDPFGSLSPRMTVADIVGEGLRVHAPELSAAERDRLTVAVLEDVQIDPATRGRYPHEFSGGQRQRIAIARAMILRPSIVVLDEPTSALDRSVQKQIVELLRRLQQQHDLSYLFISHDLAVVRAIADRVIVMQRGRVVEAGPTEEIFEAPWTDYARELIAAAIT